MSNLETHADIPVLQFATPKDWQNWLRNNYNNQLGVWIKIAKKDSGIQSVTHLEALDEALCYGWIDGMRKGYDTQAFLQKFTPRRKRSLWSKVNIGKVELLTASGRMQPQGQAEIDRAKNDGRWDAAYESQSTATAPPDLIAALQENQPAQTFYSSLTKAEKYAVLWRLMTAPTPTTRTKRLQAMVDTLAKQQKI